VRFDRLLRQARREKGLSQAQLARHARTSQSAIARYERAVSTPSLATLERLLRACGRPLLLTTAAARRRRPTRPPTARRPHAALVRRYRGQLLAAARRNGARRVRLFGSAARGDDLSDSDVDLLVELDPDRTLLDLIAFQQDASDILGVPVDAATPEILKDRVRERVLAEAVPL
jgi:predicted nucleotidyltransferase/DNA-binding XRE family transcriptional regulator